MTARQRQRATIPWGAPSSVANVFDAWASIQALDWQIDAACRDLDPEMFFLRAGGNAWVDAKRACGLCPVRNECLDWALGFSDDEDMYGIIAGTGPAARKKTRRDRAAAQVAA